MDKGNAIAAEKKKKKKLLWSDLQLISKFL